MAWSLAVASLLASGIARSQEQPASKVAVQLAAGETYVIDQLRLAAPARIDIVNNPNALVVNNGIPGELMLVGAEAGRWEISVQRANGQRVIYEVTVTSIGRPFSNPLAPGKLPPAPGQMTVNQLRDQPESQAIISGPSRTIEVGH
jgi:hypothetical protein